MLFRNRVKELPGRQMIGFGMACMSTAALITVGGLSWLSDSDLINGFLFGLASVLAGLSIVLNVRGMVRLRAEQSEH